MMHNRIRLLLMVVGFFMSFMTYADPVSPPIASDNIHQAITSNELAPTTKEKSTNTAPITAKLNLIQENRRLYARVFIQQSQNIPGKILVEWTPPHGNCMKSHYELTYAGEKFHTQSYRTIGFLNKNKAITCHGSWQVAVKDQSGSQLAVSNINIASS